MYEAFYGLRERPFDLTPNPRFLLLTGKHREALSNLVYGLTSRRGLTVLIVAHRPTLLRGVDKLLVLREGAVELFGPRGTVMARVARPVKEVA